MPRPTRPVRPASRTTHRGGGVRAALASLLAAVLLVGVGGVPAQAASSGVVLDEGFAARVGAGFEGPSSAGFGADAEVETIVPMPDGGYVVGGSFTSYQGQPAPGLARLTADLELDPAFMTLLASGFNGRTVNAVVPMPDGGFVIGMSILGQYQGQHVGGLLRLTPTLEIDAAFRAMVGTGIGSFGAIRDLVPMPDGGFVIAGSFRTFRGHDTPGGLIRVDDQLNLDAGFAAALGTGFSSQVEAARPLPDGGWLVGGNFASYQGQPVDKLARLTADLRLAPVDIPPLLSANSITAVTVLPDGGALIAGQAMHFTGESEHATVMRLSDRMQPVEAVLPEPVAGTLWVTALVPMADGSHLFVGARNSHEPAARLGIGRFLPATVGLAPVPDQAGYAGFPADPVQLAGSRAPASLPGVTYTATDLPAGLDLDGTTGRITGTPTAPGTVTVRLTAHLATLTDTVTTTWDVRTPTPPGLVGDPHAAVVGGAYDFAPDVTGAPAVTVTVRDGALPDGLVLDPRTGAVSGTPTTPGTYRFTLAASNGSVLPEAVRDVTLEVLPAPVAAAVPVEGPAAAPDPVDPAADPVPDAPDGPLAVTGSSVGVVLGVGGLLLTVGLALALGVGSVRRGTGTA